VTGRPQAVVVGSRGDTYTEPLTSYVWLPFSSRWARPTEPVFHRQGDPQRTSFTDPIDRRRKGWRRDTTCGRLIAEVSWLIEPVNGDSDYRHRDTGLEVPLRWALRFGRPCKRCWP
jgi:hypothetical protein